MADAAGAAAGGTGGTGGTGGQGAGGAGAVAGGTPPAGGGGAPAPHWTDGFSEDTKGYITNKGFQNPAALADAYRNLEKLHSAGPDKLLRIPDNWDSPEGKQAWERIGTPKEAKDYDINIPKENGDPKLADWFRDVAFKNNMTKSQAENFVKSWNEKQAQFIKEQTDAAATAQKTAETNLKNEWGAAFDKNKNLVEQTAKILGLTQEEAVTLGRTLGPEKAPKFLLKLAAAVNESEFISGTGPSSGPMDSASAVNRVNQLTNDPAFMKRYTGGDKNAITEMTQAFQNAYQGEQFLG